MKSIARPTEATLNYLELAQAVYQDACAKCPAGVFDVRDVLTIRHRVEVGGVSFLTITLPDFCKDFERSLAQGCIEPAAFKYFKKVGSIPSFLRGMLALCFDLKTGELRDEVSPTVVEAVRQVCLAFKKMELECTPRRRAAAVDTFVNVEQINKEFAPDADTLAEFAAVSDVLWHNCLAGVEPADCLPRHGPGATAERVSGNQKYAWRYWHERLEEFFPFFGSGYTVAAAEETDLLERVTFLSAESEPPVRVVMVPKTLKSPRVIAIEPACMQYAQQAIRGVLYQRIESYWLTAGRINFRDQSVNQRLALASSSTGQFATIDLSDASDRVPVELALYMFRSNPWLRGAVEACRSTGAVLPDGRVIAPLWKFASMGSALTFPVESMYFYTVCVAALLKSKNLSLTPANVNRVSWSIRVYGDDIIVPSEAAGTVLSYLQRYNCKVNASKSFWTGRFRESCGVDAFGGQNVTPTYIRQPRPEDRKSTSAIVSWIATANLFYQRGYWRTAELMFCTCELALGGKLPYVSETSPALGRIPIAGTARLTTERWNPEYQRLELRAWVPHPVKRSDKLDGYPALTKCLLRLEGGGERVSDGERLSALQKGFVLPDVDVRHLERTSLRGAVTLKRRWVPVT